MLLPRYGGKNDRTPPYFYSLVGVILLDVFGQDWTRLDKIGQL